MTFRHNNTRSTATTILCIVLALCAGILYGDDWPQFNGPGLDNISQETGLLKQWPESGPKMLWAKAGFGGGYATVAIADGTIYTTGKVGDNMIVFALNMDGTTKWQVANGPGWGGSLPGVRCTPTIDGEHVYVMSGNGRVVCLQAADGAEVWAVDVKDKYNGQFGDWGYAESLLIDGDKVICTPAGNTVTMVALDKSTGAEIWKSGPLNVAAGYVSPIVMPHGDRHLVIGSTGKGIFGVDAADGELLWNHEQVNVHGINAQTPLHHDGHVFTSTGWDTGSVLLKLSEDGAAVTEVWRNKDLDNDFGSVIFLDGHFYGFNWLNNSRGQFVCVEFGSGKTVYAEFPPGRTNKGAITWADGMFYCYDEGGVVWLGTADATGPVQIVSQFRIVNGGDQHWAHPVVSNGVLYIRHGNYLHAFDVGAG